MNTNLNGFPTDGTYGTQTKYDMFTKHMAQATKGLETTTTSTVSFSEGNELFGVAFGFILLILGLIVNLIWIIGSAVFCFIIYPIFKFCSQKIVKLFGKQ